MSLAVTDKTMKSIVNIIWLLSNLILDDFCIALTLDLKSCTIKL